MTDVFVHYMFYYNESVMTEIE